jgi:hypothetical protein
VPTEVIRSAATLKRLQSTARDAIRAVLELGRVQDADLFGRYVLREHEDLDDEVVGEVVDLLHLARQTYPTQQIEVIVIANIGIDMEERNGSTGGIQRHQPRG